VPIEAAATLGPHGILLSIAIPSYLGFQKKAQQTAAASDVREAIPDAEAFYSDNNTYATVSITNLQTYDSGSWPTRRRFPASRPPRAARRTTASLRTTRAGSPTSSARAAGRLRRVFGLLRHLDCVITQIAAEPKGAGDRALPLPA